MATRSDFAPPSRSWALRPLGHPAGAARVPLCALADAARCRILSFSFRNFPDNREPPSQPRTLDHKHPRYHGPDSLSRCCRPPCLLTNPNLTTIEVTFNRNVVSDRIIVGKFFGRLCVEWGICAAKFRWAENLYDPILRLCVPLTNLGIKYKPLRCVDSENYNQHLNQLFHIGAEIAKKKAESARKYRLKRRRTLQERFYAPSDDEV